MFSENTTLINTTIILNFSITLITKFSKLLKYLNSLVSSNLDKTNFITADLENIFTPH